MCKYSFHTLNQIFDGQSGVKRSKVYELLGEETWKISVMEDLALYKKKCLDIAFNCISLDETLDYVCT